MQASPFHCSEDVLARARAVRVLFLDVDGVLTDGGLQFSDQGEVLKRFNTLDGHGIKLLQKSGIATAVVTGRDSAPLRLRLQQLGVQHARFGTEDKAPAAQAILEELGLTWSQAAAMGDDWPDLPMLMRSRLACVPANAHPECIARAHMVTSQRGGHGAVRAVCDVILQAHGAYAALLESYTR